MSLVAWYPLNGNLKDISGNHYDLNTNYLYGDVNQDGKIDSTDSDLVLSYFNGSATLTDNQKILADVTQDNKINAKDSKAILDYVNGTGTEGLVGRPSNVQRFNPTWVDGKTGRYALKIDQDYFATNWITIEQLKNKHFEFSISLWVKQETPTIDHRDLFDFVTHKEFDNTDEILRLESKITPELRIFNNRHLTSNSGLTTLDSVDLTTWVHLTIVFYLDKAVIYKNGKYKKEQVYQNSSEGIVLEGRFRLGNIIESNYCNSTINNIKIYDHCLSKEEAYQDYLSPMLHYTFENPYAEETENIKHIIFHNTGAGAYTNISYGSDDKGDYFIKTPKGVGSDWAAGPQIDQNIVYGGNYYTWSIEVNPDIDLTLKDNHGANWGADKFIWFDRNIMPTSVWSGNDEGCDVVYCYEGNIPKNTWTRVWITCYVKQTIGKAKLFHAFCPNVNSGQIKVYYRNSMLEKKDHMTPYTRDRREGQLIRDVSGQGNDGKVIYRREEIPFVQTSMPNGIFTRSDYNGVSNMSSILGYLKHDPKYFYLGSIISYEFDIKLENIVKKIENGTPYCHLGGATVRTDGTQYWSDHTATVPGGGPIQMTNITPRINNFANGTYHITIEKKITDPNSILNAKAYHFNLVPGYITGKITISNLHFYHQNLDTSTLGITDRDNAIGTHSAHFNGKNLILVENKENLINVLNKKEFTISCWINFDHLSIYDTYLFFFGENIVGKGLHSRLEIYDNLYQLFIGYYGDSTKCTIDASEFINKWVLATFVVNGNNRKIYINGELNISEDVTSQLSLSIDGNYTFGGEYIYSQKSLQGHLNDIRMYPIALTDEEVKALYRTKAKIDKDSNMYTNQLVETKHKKIFELNENITTAQFRYGTYTKTFKDGIYTFKVDNPGYNNNQCGPFIPGSNFNLITGKHYRYSLWVKFPRKGRWTCFHERLHPKDLWFVVSEPNKWQYVECDGIASSSSLQAFIFYHNKATHSDPLQSGDEIQIRDFKFYRIDDDLLPVERDTDPKITKKAQIKGFELNEIDYDRLTKRQNIIEKDGAKWVEVFYHNTNNNTVWFANEAEALHCTSQYKYSRLDCLEQYRQADGKFEFLLEYPEIPDQFNRWKQTDNPATTEEINGSAVSIVNGYEAIHIDWSGVFGGLLKHKGANNYNRCFIDGCTNFKDWFYCIGCYDNRAENMGEVNWANNLPGQHQSSSLPGYSSSNPAHEVRLYTRISDEQINLGPTIINKYGAQWLEVFYHNNHNGTVLFANKEEAMHTIGNKDKYSILDCLEQYRGKDNKFEFLLEYPTDFPNIYNRWKQADNPAEVKETIIIHEIEGELDASIVFPNAKGYEPIHIDMDGNSGNQQRWGGLLLSSRPETLIDGSVGSDHWWWWSIGSMVSYTEEGKTGIPAIELSNNIDHAVCQNDIRLYVRIDNIDNRQQIAKLLKTGTIKTKEIKEI